MNGHRGLVGHTVIARRSIRALVITALLGLFLVGCRTAAPVPIGDSAPALWMSAEALPSAITLRWTDEAVDRDGYVVERKLVGGEFSAIATTARGAVSHVDDDVEPHIVYVYRVRTLPGVDDEALSNEVAETTAVGITFDPHTYEIVVPGATIVTGGIAHEDVAVLPPRHLSAVIVGDQMYFVYPELAVPHLSMRNSFRALAARTYGAQESVATTATPHRTALHPDALRLGTGVDMRQARDSGDAAFEFLNRKKRWVALEIITAEGSEIRFMRANGSTLSMNVFGAIFGSDPLLTSNAPSQLLADIPPGASVRVYGSHVRSLFLSDARRLFHFFGDTTHADMMAAQAANSRLVAELTIRDSIDFILQPVIDVLLAGLPADEESLDKIAECVPALISNFIEPMLDAVNGLSAGLTVESEVRKAVDSVLQEGVKDLATCVLAETGDALIEALLIKLSLLAKVSDAVLGVVDATHSRTFVSFAMPELRISYEPPAAAGGSTLLDAGTSNLYSFSRTGPYHWTFGDGSDPVMTTGAQVHHSFAPEHPAPTVDLATRLTESTIAVAGSLRYAVEQQVDLTAEGSFPYALLAGTWVGTAAHAMTGDRWTVRLTLGQAASMNAIIGEVTYPTTDCVARLVREPEDFGGLVLRRERLSGTCSNVTIRLRPEGDDLVYTTHAPDDATMLTSGVLVRLGTLLIPDAFASSSYPSRIMKVQLSEYGSDEALGQVRTGTGASLNLFDVAYCPEGELFGVTNNGFYGIDPDTHMATFIASIPSNANSLVCAPDGALYAGIGTSLYLLRRDGPAILIGNTGLKHTFSGDLVFDDEGVLFGTVSGPGSDLLVSVNAISGAAEVIGPIQASSAVWGLSFQQGQLYGLTGESGRGQLLVIDRSTGEGQRIRYLSFTATGANRLIGE